MLEKPWDCSVIQRDKERIREKYRWNGHLLRRQMIRCRVEETELSFSSFR